MHYNRLLKKSKVLKYSPILRQSCESYL